MTSGQGQRAARELTAIAISGDAVATFTVASTPRVFDRRSGEWKDGDALFLRCQLWRQPAENLAESLNRGARVVVTGKLKQRTFETREGERRSVMELDVDELGASIRYATVKVNKAGRRRGGVVAATDAELAAADEDAWSTAAVAGREAS